MQLKSIFPQFRSCIHGRSYKEAFFEKNRNYGTIERLWLSLPFLLTEKQICAKIANRLTRKGGLNTSTNANN